MDGESMSWAIFSDRFDWRRERSRFSFTALPSENPQQFPRDMIAAAVAKGKAKEADSPRGGAARKKREASEVSAATSERQQPE